VRSAIGRSVLLGGSVHCSDDLVCPVGELPYLLPGELVEVGRQQLEHLEELQPVDIG